MDTVICGGDNATLSNAESRYNMINAAGNGWSTTESLRHTLIAASVSMKNLYVTLSAAPGVTFTRTFTVYKNGSPTALAVTISGTNTAGSNVSDTVSFAANDTISLEASFSPGISSTNKAYWTLLADGAVRTSVIQGGTNENVSGSSARYCVISGGGSSTSLSYGIRKTFPTQGTVSKLYVKHSVNNTVNTTYTLVKNGVSTSLTATIASGNTSASDTSNSVSISPGDIVYLLATYSGSAASHYASWGCVFAPTINGESVHMHSTDSTISSGYNYIGSYTGFSWDASLANRLSLMPACTVRKLYIDHFGSLGGGDTMTFTFVDDSSDTALSAVLSSTSTNSNTSNSVAVAAGSLVAMRCVISGSPSQSASMHSFVTYVIPTGDGITVNKVVNPAKVCSVPIANIYKISGSTV